MTDLVALTRISEKYQLKKAEKPAGFQRPEQSTLRILQNPAIAAEVREQYAYVFWTNIRIPTMAGGHHQADCPGTIITLWSGTSNRHYRFRLADPMIFIGKYHAFSQETDARRPASLP